VNPIEHVHGRYVASRRARVIAARLAKLLPADAYVLDVGCGDGEIAALIQSQRPDVTVRGVDVLVREHTRVPVEEFDGRTLPFADGSFDAVMFIDVLHHCQWPIDLLREARRVSRRAIVIKDHLLQGVGARRTLRFMDDVGNRRYGVVLPHNYLRPHQWKEAFAELELSVEHMDQRLGLYPWPFSLVFDRHLHFVARLALAFSDGVAESTNLAVALV
jgi:SAM-dependent methyltransferase